MSSKTELYNNIRKLKDNVEENQKEKRDRWLIKEYGNSYVSEELEDDEDDEEFDEEQYEEQERREQVDLQYNLLVGLHKKKPENTLVDKYIDIMIDEINCQYGKKSDLENKTGFILAFIGVLIAGILGKDNLLYVLVNTIKNNDNIWCIETLFLVVILILTLIAIVAAAIAIIKQGYTKYDFEEKKLNYECLIEDNEMMYVKLVDSITNSLTDNEEVNKIKFISLSVCVYATIALTFIVVFASIFVT